MSGEISTTQDIHMGTPQGSRLSPLLFIMLMADMDLWTNESMLSNFADDTQSIVISNDKENAIKTTENEAKRVIEFFGANYLVNNPEKAAILYNSNGKSSEILFEDMEEKKLNLHIQKNF